MMGRDRFFFCFLLLTLVLSIVPGSDCWWFSGGRCSDGSPPSYVPRLAGGEFAMKSLDNNERAIGLVENAKLHMRSPETCWSKAYGSVFTGCSKIVADQELKDRLTWDLSNCFQKHSGRPEFPYCNPKHPTKNCLKNLDDDAHKVFLQYFLQVDSICHQLQIHAFKHQTERLVNELKKSAEYAEEKLENIEERGEILLQNSKHIHDSLKSIDFQTGKVAESSKHVQENVDKLKVFSKELHEQSRGIAASQAELNVGQRKMRENMEQGIQMLHESYDNLGSEISSLKNETVEIEQEIDKLGVAMFSKMDILQSKADDIENITGSSLDKQKQLLESQSAALEGLAILKSFQSQALEESRNNLQKLSEFGKKQQEELLLRQEHLQQANDHLADSSKRILRAQEAFETKQARMLNALDKLFALHNALLIESRLVKVFIIYSLLIFAIYMFTSMKQTYNIRHRLYTGLCVTLLIELSIMRSSAYILEHQTWMATCMRSLFLFLASAQFLYSLYTYRDYEKLNHQILLTLIDKLNSIQHKESSLQWEDTDDEDSVNWGSWLTDELPEDVAQSEDPDFFLTEYPNERTSSSERYNFRHRRHPTPR